ncbi:carbohydrate ABC transporter permease [Paenibacillus alba]|uniref:carbohydrate ABC transporter permease n=1 Tax=Paenibacillus alba TaxID=1197127 RepID=UPI001566798A|nr:carbohydrate ABC transporter permease [Paenibacillus alba]NQX66934.1 carbohydrate ABC transporter permease [Paenibacillus alba]
MKIHLVPRPLGYLLMLIMVILYLYPLLYLFNVSFKPDVEFIVDPVGIVKHFQPENYVNAWKQGNFSTYIWNSILYTGVAVGASVLISALAAFPVSRSYIKWSNFVYVFFMIAIFLPNNMIPQWNLIHWLGLYNTRIGYILVNTGIGLGFMLMTGYIKAVPRELDEAASIDGCSYSRYVMTIIMPLIKPVLATSAILQAIGVWNNVIGATIYLSDKKLFPIVLGLFKFYGQFSNQWTLLAAALVIVASPMIILYIFLQRYIIEGAMTGAVKS